MSNIFCNTCAYYQQHYTFNRNKIFRVYCGHCTHKRAKIKRPDARACEHYLPSDSTEETFVTKEYLSKALLEYAMGLELLPEIYDIDEE